MKNITISRIDATNPVVRDYVDAIKSWDNSNGINVEKDNKIIPFYAIYFNARFLAASTISFDKEKSLVQISMINNSNSFYSSLVEDEAQIELENIALSQYQPKNIEFSCVKKKKIS